MGWVYGREPTRGRGESRRSGGGQTGLAPPPQRGEERHAKPLGGLFGEGPQVPTSLLQPVHDLDADHRFARNEGRQEGFYRLLLDQPENISNPVGRERPGVGRKQLVEHRFGVPHATGRQTRDQVDRTGLRRSAVALENRAQLAADLGYGEPPKVETLDAREDGGSNAARIGRAEDEDRVVGRLFERLEEDVPALADALDLVDDEYLATQIRGRREDARQQFAHVADGVVRGGIELLNVERPAVADGLARRAGIARLAVAEIRAVEGLGQDAGHRGLARAARSNEEVRVGGPPGANAVAHRLDDGLLADDLAERLSAPASIYGLMWCVRAHDAPAGGCAKNERPSQPVGRGCECRAPFFDSSLPRPLLRAAQTRPNRGTRRSSLSAASFRI